MPYKERHLFITKPLLIATICSIYKKQQIKCCVLSWAEGLLQTSLLLTCPPPGPGLESDVANISYSSHALLLVPGWSLLLGPDIGQSLGAGRVPRSALSLGSQGGHFPIFASLME